MADGAAGVLAIQKLMASALAPFAGEGWQERVSEILQGLKLLAEAEELSPETIEIKHEDARAFRAYFCWDDREISVKVGG